MKFLWITDPWESLDHARDTTLRLAQAALALGHRSFWCDVRSIRAEGPRVRLDAYPLRLDRQSPGGVQRGKPVAHECSAFDRLVYRTDPPVDLAYLHPLQLLVRGLGPTEAERRLVNPAPVLTLQSEKLEGAQLAALGPRALCSSQKEALLAFLAREGKAVLKPLHQAQSKGVHLLSSEDRAEAESALARATDAFTRPALLQEYLPAIRSEGETRLWFLDGTLLAAIRKHALEGDFRVQIDQGSRLSAATLKRAERSATLAIGKHLRKTRVRMAAVDLVQGKVTDYNVTSPGLIRQMEELLDQDLATPIVRALARPFGAKPSPAARPATARKRRSR